MVSSSRSGRRDPPPNNSKPIPPKVQVPARPGSAAWRALGGRDREYLRKSITLPSRIGSASFWKTLRRSSVATKRSKVIRRSPTIASEDILGACLPQALQGSFSRERQRGYPPVSLVEIGAPKPVRKTRLRSLFRTTLMHPTDQKLFKTTLAVEPKPPLALTPAVTQRLGSFP